MAIDSGRDINNSINGVGTLAVDAAGVNGLKRAAHQNPNSPEAIKAELASLKACRELVNDGFRPIATSRDQRFEAKVQLATAVCRGGDFCGDVFHIHQDIGNLSRAFTFIAAGAGKISLRQIIPFGGREIADTSGGTVMVGQD